MDKRLETYLQTVESELGEMREARREAELREMRQHLEAIVARLTEGGLSEEEATEAAIAQFGAARQVGRELEKVGTRKESLLRMVAAPLGGVLCYAVLSLGMSVIDEFLRGIFTRSVIAPGIEWRYHGPVGIFLMCWPMALASGAVSGFISPRWGGRLLLGYAGLFSVACGVVGGYEALRTFWLPLAVSALPGLLLSHLSGILVGARWASRLSQKRVQRQLA